ncbi:NAD(P)H-dependent oxidoreductase [Methylopila turkensis]|uniref:FMN reductase n=1 Tax=Methylopila turkensis TaxID=1437816 RepID=A0A9W6N7F4_9HYPH|nr:NAD(P)H-dependent oxidoreductase [Methylopila turkensis]GLK81189.1 FMN reductase [Methylopila turkensis]
MTTRKSIVAITGSLSQPSRTRRLVEDVAARVQSRSGGAVTLIDVAEIGPDLGQAFSRGAASPALEETLRAIESADLIIAGSPIYKGSYTGFFKHLIDLVDYRALAGVPVALLATGGSDRHALAVEHQLRPLFGSFDALTLPTAVFVIDRDVVDGRVTDERVARRLDTLVSEAAGALARPAIAA